MKTKLLYFLVLLFGTFHAKAQNADSVSRSHQLDEVMVSGENRAIKRDTLSNTLKQNIPLLHIPQNIQSVGNALLREQGVFTLSDAARNASGVYFGLNNNMFDGASNLYMRGFAQNRIFRNGLPAMGYGTSQDDEALIERIEFIKGPAGFLGSSGEAGGSINVVTKVPQPEDHLRVDLVGGSWDFYRAAVDVGTATREKGLSMRLNSVYNYQGYFVRGMHSKKFIVAPVLQYNFSKYTYLLAEYVLNDQRGINGSTFSKRFPEEQMLQDDKHANYQADPGLPVSKSKDQYARLAFVHQLNHQWKITSQTSWKKTPSDVWSFFSADTYNTVGFDENGKTERISWRVAGQTEVIATQLFLNGHFQTGQGVDHRLMVGGEFFYTTDSTYQAYGTVPTPFDRYNLQYGIDRNTLTQQETYNSFTTNNRWAAAYLYDNIYIGSRFILTLGGRYTYNERKSDGLYQSGTTTLYSKAFSPRAGLTFLLDDRTSAYFLYDQSFVPTSGQDASGNNFKPIRGEDAEIGIKRKWFSNILNTGITAYQIYRNNMTTQDPENPSFSRQLGQVRSRGVEVDILGNITPNLAISANYAYIDARVNKDTDEELVGNRYSSSPQQVINSWVRYSFPWPSLQGLSVSLGQSTIVKKATTTVDVNIPDYTKLDGSIAYRWRKYQARLLLDNITNRRYIRAGDIYGGMATYTEGMPFNFKIAFSVNL